MTTGLAPGAQVTFSKCCIHQTKLLLATQSFASRHGTFTNQRLRVTATCGGFGAVSVLLIGLMATFGLPLLGLVNYAAHSELYSYILLIPSVSAYLLYLRRDQFPKKNVTDVPLAVVSLAAGLGVLALISWLDFARRRRVEHR